MLGETPGVAEVPGTQSPPSSAQQVPSTASLPWGVRDP